MGDYNAPPDPDEDDAMEVEAPTPQPSLQPEKKREKAKPAPAPRRTRAAQRNANAGAAVFCLAGGQDTQGMCGAQVDAQKAGGVGAARAGSSQADPSWLDLDSEAEESLGFWMCSACTFANPDLCASHCEVCDAVRQRRS